MPMPPSTSTAIADGEDLATARQRLISTTSGGLGEDEVNPFNVDFSQCLFFFAF